MWSRGDVVALRDIWFGAVWRAVAGIMVEDTPERSVFWIPAGPSRRIQSTTRAARSAWLGRSSGAATRRTRRRLVLLCDEGAPWTIWHFFAADGAFDRWYVNFEQLPRTERHAYDCVDHKLDLIVRAGGELEWKDEDELERAGQLGLVDAGAVRRDAERTSPRTRGRPAGRDYRARSGVGRARAPRGLGPHLVAAGSRAGPYTPRRRCRRRSGAGAHQFQLPRIAIRDGTSSALTTVASSATAAAVPTPSSCTKTSRDVANEPIATQKRSAAAVTMRPVRSRPQATAVDVRHRGRAPP